MSNETTHPDNLMTMEELLATYGQGLEALYTGQILSGSIMQVSRHEILIDVGAKSEGVVEAKELDKMTEEDLKKLSPGDTIRVFVVRPESMDGHPILSIARAKMEQDWEEAERLKTEDEIFETRVLGANKGGLIVNIGQVRGFVPASQVSSLRRNSGEGEEEYQRRLMTLTGKILKFKVLELDRRRNRLIMSERAADREWRRDQKEKLLDNLQPGMVVKGEVSSVADFGAFVDLGGADGLIHLSELSWGRIQHPSEVVKVGDGIDVQVLTVDRERRRIALSLKRLQPEPWTQFVDQHNVGDLVEATITKLTNFGAFARVVDTEIEGLIHISELAEGRVDRPGSVVAEGESVNVTIIRIDSERKRLGLSLRAPESLQLTDDSEAAAKAPEPAAVVEAEEAPEPAAIVEAEEAPEPAAVVAAEQAPEAEAVVETDEASEAEAVVEAEEAPETEAVVEAEQAPEAEAVAEAEEVSEAEAVVEAEEASEAEAIASDEEEAPEAVDDATEDAPEAEAEPVSEASE